MENIERCTGVFEVVVENYGQVGIIQILYLAKEVYKKRY